MTSGRNLERMLSSQLAGKMYTLEDFLAMPSLNDSVADYLRNIFHGAWPCPDKPSCKLGLNLQHVSRSVVVELSTVLHYQTCGFLPRHIPDQATLRVLLLLPLLRLLPLPLLLPALGAVLLLPLVVTLLLLLLLLLPLLLMQYLPPRLVLARCASVWRSCTAGCGVWLMAVVRS